MEAKWLISIGKVGFLGARSRIQVISNTSSAGRSIADYGKKWKRDFWPNGWYTESKDNYENEAQKLKDENKIEDILRFTNDDQIITNKKVGKWLLSWQMKNSGMPYKKRSIQWLYIHHVFPNAIPSDEDYPGLVIEEKEKWKPEPPFELDGKTQQAIKKVLARDEYIAFREEPEDETGWKTQQIDHLMDDWITDVIAEYDRLR